jgi:hypothetical protein
MALIRENDPLKILTHGGFLSELEVCDRPSRENLDGRPDAASHQ